MAPSACKRYVRPPASMARPSTYKGSTVLHPQSKACPFNKQLSPEMPATTHQFSGKRVHCSRCLLPAACNPKRAFSLSSNLIPRRSPQRADSISFIALPMMLPCRKNNLLNNLAVQHCTCSPVAKSVPSLAEQRTELSCGITLHL